MTGFVRWGSHMGGVEARLLGSRQGKGIEGWELGGHSFGREGQFWNVPLSGEVGMPTTKIWMARGHFSTLC